jgi:integrase/recombinase XerD
MNRNPSGLLFSLCIDGFVKYKTAEGLSQRTVDSYEWVLRKWMEKIGDQPVGKITSADVLDYMTYLRTEYVPHTFAKPNPAHEAPTRKLSPKTLRNHWITFKAFFGWAVAEFKIKNPMEGIPGPRYKEAPVAAFTQEDLAALLKACTYSREYNPINRHNFVTRRPSAKRDEAMIMFMLDTGLRASELCSLKIGELDLRTGKVVIKHGDEGGARAPAGLYGAIWLTAKIAMIQNRQCLSTAAIIRLTPTACDI